MLKAWYLAYKKGRKTPDFKNYFIQHETSPRQAYQILESLLSLID